MERERTETCRKADVPEKSGSQEEVRLFQMGNNCRALCSHSSCELTPHGCHTISEITVNPVRYKSFAGQLPTARM